MPTPARILLLALLVLAPRAHAQVLSDDTSDPGSEVTGTNAAPTGDWSRILPPNVPPPPPSSDVVPAARMLQSEIYDPDSDRMITFGGIYFSFAYDEVLATSLSTGHWTKLQPSGVGPGPRRDHVSVYDSARKRMIVFGGSGVYDSYLGDTWALSLDSHPAWTELSTAGSPPPARFSHAGIYDPVRDRLVVFGGYSNGAFVNDVWALDFAGGNTWTQVPATGDVPSVRDAMTTVYDAGHDRMLVFGGWTGTTFDNRVWALSLAGTPTWSLLGTVGTPPSPRRHYAASYDASADRLVLWGGYDNSLTYRNDAWELALSGTPTWSPIAAAGTAPTPRNGHRAIFDPVRNRLVTFGGYGGNYLGDLWELSLGASPAWTKLDIPIPPPPPPSSMPGVLRDHVAVYDAPRDRMIVFGGSKYYDTVSNDVHALSLGASPKWSSVAATGTKPAARFSHAGLYDPVRQRLVIFGGYDGAFRNDAWALALGGSPAWSPINAGGTPPSGRDAMTTLYDSARDRLLVFGGWTGREFKNDLWALSFVGTPAWTRLDNGGVGNRPSARRHYAAIYDALEDRIVLTGGVGADGERDDTWTLKFNGDGAGVWKKENPRGPVPSARYGARSVYDAVTNRMIVFGGYGEDGYRGDLWTLDLAGRMKWEQVILAHPDAPAPVVFSSAIFDGAGRTIVFGGVDGETAKSDIWAFLPIVTGGSLVAPRPEARSVTPAYGLAIRSVSPNPATGPIDVRFSLPGGAPADLALYTIAGRRVAQRSVGSLGAGEHVVSFTRGDLSPGLYLVRLSDGTHVENTKVLIGIR